MKTFLSSLFLVACISGTVEDTITKTTEVSFAAPVPAGISGVSVPPTTISQSEPVDISDTLNQIEKIGSPSLTITQNHLQNKAGDFSFVDEIAVSVMVPNADPMLLMDVKLTPEQKASSDLDIPVLLSGTDLLTAFNTGPVSLRFDLTVEGNPPSNGQVDVISTITMDVSLSVSKSVSDIGK